jgi:hypothetical protein
LSGPEYNLHGDVFEDWWTPLLEELPEYQFALYDDAADCVLAEAHTGPLAWNGEVADLPDGIDDALQCIVAGHRADRPVDTLYAMPRRSAQTRAGAGLQPSCCRSCARSLPAVVCAA